ncbi:MAG TPA: response regulator [Anaerolineae bacterium]|nr:response regulator [Anaerolineae bacterium]
MAHSILVVDDDQATITLIGLMLKRQGFVVYEAQSGPEALIFLSHTIPDLVLLDVMMPAMDGYEVCRRIKANPQLKHLPVVMLSARFESASQMEGFRAGAIDYIAKPISPSDLIAQLQAVFERSEREPKPNSAVVIAARRCAMPVKQDNGPIVGAR